MTGTPFHGSLAGISIPEFWLYLSNGKSSSAMTRV